MSADKIFRYGELEAPLDVSDYVVVERIDVTLKKLGDVLAQVAESGDDPIAKLKALFFAYTDVFCEALGDDDAANKALGGSSSLDEAIAALFALIDFTRAQNASLAERWQNTGNKYAPNRAQRRAKK